MIYKIQTSNLTDAFVSGAKILVFSFDGQFVLVKSDTIIEYALESYNESSQTELFNDTLYKQPCKDC
jgi:hypothetical protein